MIKRSVPLWAVVVAAVVTLVIGVAAGSGAKKDSKTAAPVAATVTALPSAASAPAVTSTTTATEVVTVTQSAAAPAPVTVTTTEEAPSPTAPAGIGDGTYVVGTDIKPGLYKTTGPASATYPNCYWERDRDLDGGLNSIIANDNAKGPTTVKVSSTDKAFKTSGCNDWVKIG